MNRFFFACVFTLAGILLSGCDTADLTPDSSATTVAAPVTTSAEADYRAGIQFELNQHTQQACDAYASAAAKDPDNLPYLLAEAETLVALDKPADAVNLLMSKAASFPSSSVIRLEIGEILVQQKRYPEAINTLQQASTLAGDDPQISEHLAFALLLNKQYDQAAVVFGELVKEPNYTNRADVQAALGECQSRLMANVDLHD